MWYYSIGSAVLAVQVESGGGMTAKTFLIYSGNYIIHCNNNNNGGIESNRYRIT